MKLTRLPATTATCSPLIIALILKIVRVTAVVMLRSCTIITYIWNRPGRWISLIPVVTLETFLKASTLIWTWPCISTANLNISPKKNPLFLKCSHHRTLRRKVGAILLFLDRRKIKIHLHLALPVVLHFQFSQLAELHLWLPVQNWKQQQQMLLGDWEMVWGEWGDKRYGISFSLNSESHFLFICIQIDLYFAKPPLVSCPFAVTLSDWMKKFHLSK